MLEVLLIGHRQSPSELGFLYRLCRIYWEMGNAQTKATREMYLSVGLTVREPTQPALRQYGTLAQHK